MLSNVWTLLVSCILIFISWLRVTSSSSVTDSKMDLLVPAALILMARLECASWVQHPGLTQLYIPESCHQCIYLCNTSIFNADPSKKTPKPQTNQEVTLVIWFIVVFLCQTRQWLKIKVGELFQFPYDGLILLNSSIRFINYLSEKEKCLLVCVGFGMALRCGWQTCPTSWVAFIKLVIQIGMTLSVFWSSQTSPKKRKCQHLPRSPEEII